MVHPLISAVLSEPAVADPPARLRRDWWLVGVMVVVAIIEGIVHQEQAWRPAAVAVAVAVSVSTLWRRTHPLATTIAAFAVVEVLDQALRVVANEPFEFYSTAIVLVLPYSLFRWASGRHCLIGAALVLTTMVLELTMDWTGPGDAIGGVIVLAIPAVAGVEVRHLVTARERRVEQARSSERTLLARELHDTVAHHVSAIAVRAQAGQVVGANDPEASLDALAVIEREASRTLEEMRSIVGALRGHDEAEFSPQPAIDDIHDLADPAGTPPVRVSITPDAPDLGPAVSTALFRIAQEGVTNARRHARRASEVDIRVRVDDERVALEVRDDGRPSDHAASGQGGFGLVGMAERVALLGGSMHAGPARPHGWLIAASIPLARSR